MNKYLIIYLPLICFLHLIFTPVNGQQLSSSAFSLPSLTEKIVIDGNIDESAWAQGLIIEINTETKPGKNIAAPVSATAYLFEDGENLYVAIKAYDHESSKIRAHYHDHDYIFDDTVGIKLDPQNDNLFAYQFFVNALGVKHDSIEDGTLHEDDLSWNAIWDAAGHITDEGFQVEISIPLRIMRFDDSKPIQEWGFDLLRFYPRDTLHRISYHPVDRNIACTLCQNARMLGFKDVSTGNNFELVPYMTAMQHQTRENPLTDSWHDTGVDSNYDIDLRWGVTADTTLNTIFNPDFSQVESDVAQLDINNDFSLFYPEKRPFFIEGADYYKSMMNLVYTRNISDPDYGFKVTQSSNSNNYAAFFSNDTQTQYILLGKSSSNIASYATESINGVIRYRHDLENFSSVGAMITVRDADNYHNYVYGMDGIYRLSDTATIRAQILGSDTEDPQQVIDSFSRTNRNSDGSAIDLHYKFNDRDWLLWGRYTRFAEGFRADLGYQPRVDYKLYATELGHYWYEKNTHWWNTIYAGMESSHVYDLDGQLLQKWFNGKMTFSGQMQSTLNLQVKSGKQYWDG